MELFRIDPGLVIWTWISFGVLLFLLGKFVYPAIFSTISAREKKIRDSVSHAEKIDQRLKEIEDGQASIISQAQHEADAILKKTRDEAESLRSRMLQRAEQEIHELHEQARARIAEERSAAMESLRTELAELVCDAAAKLNGGTYGEKDDRKMVRELIETL